MLALIDFDRYPIDRPNSPEAQQLVARCAREFASDGVAVLPGFVTAEAVAAVTNEAETLVAKTFFCDSTHNVMLDDGDPSFDDAHARNRALATRVGSIANDYLGPTEALQRLYDDDRLTEFVSSVLGRDTLYRGADPLGALSVNVYGDGDRHSWHFDESEFTITIMIQEPEAGGRFDYVTGLRSDDDQPDLDAIGEVLDGDESTVKHLPFEPGSLLIFGGRHTMHRVTPVQGDRHRFVPVLTYSTVPGQMNSDEVRQLFWGRT